MNKVIFATALVSFALFTVSAWADDSHHPAENDTQTIEQMTMDQSSPTVANLEKMREKVELETDPAKRQDLMHQHMEMMHECMKMMHQKSGVDKEMSHSDNQQMSMEKRMAMMEHMMSLMMSQMMGSMMATLNDNETDSRMKMMEDRMDLMQEMMRGILMQQGMKDQLNTTHSQ